MWIRGFKASLFEEHLGEGCSEQAGPSHGPRHYCDREPLAVLLRILAFGFWTLRGRSSTRSEGLAFSTSAGVAARGWIGRA